jgi:hypothetical protein
MQNRPTEQFGATRRARQQSFRRDVTAAGDPASSRASIAASGSRTCAASTGCDAFAGQFSTARRAVKQNALAKRNFTFVNLANATDLKFSPAASSFGNFNSIGGTRRNGVARQHLTFASRLHAALSSRL